MNTIEIKKENVIKAFSEGTEDIKKVLQTLFGEKVFKNKDNWIEKWESFCKENDITVTLPYSSPSNSNEESANAYAMLIHIARIKNDGWKPDWNNSSQYKYYPWFNMKSGSGFSYSGYDYDDSLSSLGSRLCFESSSLAEAVGKEFLFIYEKFLTQ